MTSLIPLSQRVKCIVLICLFSTGIVMAEPGKTFSLPSPVKKGDKSLEQLLQQRRSVREYQQGNILLREISQLLWAAQGITHIEGLRTAPSAGALYPLELYLLAGDVEGLTTGLYRYRPDGHQLTKLHNKDLRKELSQAALKQSWIQEAGIIVVFTAVYERTTWKYGERGIRFVHMDAGIAAENLFLQAEAHELATVIVGAFEDEKVANVLKLPAEVKPLLLMPVGRK